MTNEELWRSMDDAIIPAPATMIVVPVPVALPPEAAMEQVVGEEVAAKVELDEMVAEVAVDEISAERAVIVETEEVVEEVVSEVAEEGVVTDESSGSWWEVEEIVGAEVDVSGPATADDKSPEDGCARVLSLEEYWDRSGEKRWEIGVATLVTVGDSAKVITPLIPEIDLQTQGDTGWVVLSAEVGTGNTRRVVLKEKMTSTSRPSPSGEKRSHGEEKYKSDHKKTRKHKSQRREGWGWGSRLVGPPYRPCCCCGLLG